MLVLVGVGAVEPVVGGHDRAGLSLLHGDLEIGQVHLPQRALVHHGIGGHAQHLLAVGGEVLGTGGNALLLYAADEASGHLILFPNENAPRCAANFSFWLTGTKCSVAALR